MAKAIYKEAVCGCRLLRDSSTLEFTIDETYCASVRRGALNRILEEIAKKEKGDDSH